MHKPSHVIEIFLQPGEHYFGNRDTRIRTVLGSCVSLAFWHPRHLIGGMCHYMLPSNAKKRGSELDGRYADEAMALMLREIRNSGTCPGHYHVKLFGGGDMFPGHRRQPENHVGRKNIAAARQLLQVHGLICVAEHLGGTGHRNVIFDIWSGHVWLKHQAKTPAACGNCETRELCSA